MDKGRNSSSSPQSKQVSAAEINVFKPMSFLSTPAVIALVAYVILSLVIILPFEIPMKNDKTGEVVIVKYNFAERLLVLLLLTLPFAFSIYSINCMVVGNCDLLSYLISFLTVIWVAIFVVISFMFTFSR